MVRMSMMGIGAATRWGLSFSQFEMSDLRIDDSAVDEWGAVAGAHVGQVYVSQRPPSINRPVKGLKGSARRI
jgi:hypothetical protein